MFDKRNQFQLWHDVCYLGNTSVRNKRYIGGHVFVELYSVRFLNLSLFLDRASCTDADNDPNFQPDCLPPVESTDLLFYLVLETSFFTQQQFKAFRSLKAYNQMVSGFITGVKGHIIASKFVVLAKVTHTQRINDSLIPIWIITEKEGTILSAHCLGCKAGLAESLS